MGTVAGGTKLEVGKAVPVPTVRRPARRIRVRPGRVLKYVVMSAIAILFIAPFVYMVSASFLPLSQMFKYPPQWIPLHPTISNYSGFFTSNQPILRWIL